MLILFMVTIFFPVHPSHLANQKWESPDREVVFIDNSVSGQIDLISRSTGLVIHKFDKRLMYVKWSGNGKFIGILADWESSPWELSNASTFIYDLKTKKKVEFPKDPYCGGGMIVIHDDVVVFDCKIPQDKLDGPKVFFKNYHRKKFFEGKIKEIVNSRTPKIRSVRKKSTNLLPNQFDGYLIQFDSIGMARECKFETGGSFIISYYHWERSNFIDEGFFYCELILKKETKKLPRLLLRDSKGSLVSSLSLAGVSFVDSTAWGEISGVSLAKINNGDVLSIARNGLLSGYFLQRIDSNRKIEGSFILKFDVDTDLIIGNEKIKSLPLRVRSFSWGSNWSNILMKIPFEGRKEEIKAVRFDGKNEHFVQPVRFSKGFIEVPLENIDRSTYYLVNSDYKLGAAQ